MESVKFTVKTFDNFIEITPDDGVLDNYVYEIRLNNIKELGGTKVLENETISVVTAMNPGYTSLDSVKQLVGVCNISDKDILYNIKDASKYVSYIVMNADPTKFEIQQFVKFRAAHQCVLQFYINAAAQSTKSKKGTIGDVSYEKDIALPDISKLLKELEMETKVWEDAAQGYLVGAGHAAPKSTLRGKSASEPPIISQLGLTYSRGV